MVVLGIAFLDLVVVFLTASFTGTICLFLGLALLLARSPEAKRVVKPLLMVAPVIGVVLGGVFWKIISERLDVQFNQAATTLIPHSFRIRIWMWRELMWPWVERFWLWGLGPYRWGWPDEESYYMFTILKAGFFGMLAYAALHVVLFFRLPRIFRGREDVAGRGGAGGLDPLPAGGDRQHQRQLLRGERGVGDSLAPGGVPHGERSTRGRDARARDARGRGMRRKLTVLLMLGGVCAFTVRAAAAADIAAGVRAGDPTYRELRIAAALGLLDGPLHGREPLSRAEVFRLLRPAVTRCRRHRVRARGSLAGPHRGHRVSS